MSHFTHSQTPVKPQTPQIPRTPRTPSAPRTPQTPQTPQISQSLQSLRPYEVHSNGAIELDANEGDMNEWHDATSPTPSDLIDEYTTTANHPRIVDLAPLFEDNGDLTQSPYDRDPQQRMHLPAMRTKEIRVITVPTQFQQSAQPSLQPLDAQSSFIQDRHLLQQKSVTVRNAAAASDPTKFNFVRPPLQSIKGGSEYVFLRVIGYGSTGTVWKCLSQSAQTLVASKVIDWNVGHLEVHDRTNVLREITAISRLNHPHIVQLIELVEDPIRDFTYIMLELVQGQDLLSYINSFTRVPEKEGKKIVAQIVLALNHCHENGIIHRDMKPENILIHENGLVKLCDFGLCCTSYTVKAEYQFVCGSPGYIAPEVVFADIYDYTCDYWGLGCLTFSMFTKLIPFGHNWIDEYERLVIQRVDPFLRFPADLSDDLINFVVNLMRTDPKLRMSKRMLTTHPWINKYVSRYEQRAKTKRLVVKGKAFSSLAMAEAIRFLGASAGIS